MTRWPIIRHLRWAWHNWRCHKAARDWGRMGIGLGVPCQSDLEMLHMIWRGEA